MATDNAASVISLHQPAAKTAMSGAERAKAYRERKRKAKPATSPRLAPARQSSPAPAPAAAPTAILSATVPLDAVDAPVTPRHVTRPPIVTTVTPPVTDRHVTQATTVTSSRPSIASALLTAAAVALAAVGVAINGWYAQSLGSSDVAGWLFLALGVAADLIALGMPSCAAGLWHARQRAASLAGWALWLVAFTFAVTAGIGFASTNVRDVTLARASRVTPAITAAHAGLSDAVAARDRECKGGVGRFCREREAAVVERRQVLDSAVASVGQRADPQPDAAVKLIAWTSRGALQPAPDDFAMLRLILLALLPQFAGVLLMVVCRTLERRGNPAELQTQNRQRRP